MRPEINEEEPEIFEKTGKTPVPKSDQKSAEEIQRKHSLAEANGLSEPISKEITLPINLGFLQFYSFVLGLGVFQTSMSFAGTT